MRLHEEMAAIGLFLWVAAMPRADLRGEIDRILARERDFSGNVLVARRGRVAYRGSFGLADRRFGVKVGAGTRFRIASITKAFTAVLVLQLAEEGRLGLDEPLRTYLPKFPGEGTDRITVRQLLNHTSGLPNSDAEIKSYAGARFQGLDQYQRAFSPDGLVARWARGPLRFEPGTKFEYNNADYIVLGRLLEAAWKKPFETVLRERILVPLGLRDSGLLRDRRIVKGLASTYYRPDGVRDLREEMPVNAENWGAAGAMYSTAGDLLRFSEALFRGRLLKPASLKAMLTPGKDDYGFGVWVYSEKIKGRRMTAVQRPGLIMGANVGVFHLRESGLTVIVLTNDNLTDVGALSRRIAEAAT